MAIVPDSRIEKVQFYEAHVPPWTANAAAIGLGPTQMDGFTPLVTAARTAYDAMITARDASKAATLNFHNKVEAMHAGAGAGADVIRDIKNHALSSADPNVYVLAQIPPPAPPSPAPAPGTPFDFSVSLLQNGALGLSWKCSNPSGTMGTIYEVKRKVSQAFEYVGSSGTRSFTDETLPAGASPVIYQITAVRSTVKGNPAQFTVSFGVGGGEMTIQSVTPLKVAA